MQRVRRDSGYVHFVDGLVLGRDANYEGFHPNDEHDSHLSDDGAVG